MYVFAEYNSLNAKQLSKQELINLLLLLEEAKSLLLSR